MGNGGYEGSQLLVFQFFVIPCRIPDKAVLDQTRLAAMNKFVEILKTKRDTIVKVLMWEICKVKADAEKEFDRTIDYIVETIKAAKALRNSESTFHNDGGIIAQIRHSPLGVMLNLGMPILESTIPFRIFFTLFARAIQLSIQRNVHHPHPRDSHGQLSCDEASQRRLSRCVRPNISTAPPIISDLTLLTPDDVLAVQRTSPQWRSFETAFLRGW